MYGRFGELLLILIIVFILFGSGKLPKVMNELGKGLRIFRKSIEEKAESDYYGNREIQYKKKNNKRSNKKKRVLKAKKRCLK